MARLDVYPMPGRKARGYVLDVQAELLADLAARTAVPLLPEEDVRAAMRDLNPVFGIDGKRHVMLTQDITTVPHRELRDPVTSLMANIQWCCGRSIFCLPVSETRSCQHQTND
ncbi:MAG TPA: CcdB family protein [Acetobacteraceae bacterium]|nr:CcdB family protein [Acetobacteraceae bacterium]